MPKHEKMGFFKLIIILNNNLSLFLGNKCLNIIK
jgi:hypothetical protein